MGWFGGGRNDHKESARNAIVELRSQLLMLEKREDHIQKQIDEETRKAKANATSNQRCKYRSYVHVIGVELINQWQWLR
jgi:charged multivesicular body protein 4